MGNGQVALDVVVGEAESYLEKVENMEPKLCPEPDFARMIKKIGTLGLKLQIAGLKQAERTAELAAAAVTVAEHARGHATAVASGVGAGAAAFIVVIGKLTNWW